MNRNSTIARLNNDCLAHVLQHFSVKQYERLRQVSPQFEEAALTCWRMKTKKWARVEKNSANEFEWIMANIGEFAEDMDFHFLEDDEIRYLNTDGKEYKTKVMRAIVDNRKLIRRRMKALNTSLRTRILVETFPLLTKLSLEGNMNCEVLSFLKDLKELHLFFRNCKAVQSFRRIFSVLKLRKLSIGYDEKEPLIYNREDFETITRCATLEEIALNAELLEILLPITDRFPKLSTIASFDLLEREGWNHKGNIVFTKIVEVLGRRVHTLHFDQLIHHSHKDLTRLEHLYLQELTNLHTLKITNIKLSLSIFSPRQLRDDFKKLRELHFLMYASSYNEYNQFDLLTAISLADKLEVLVIPNEWVDTVFKLPDLMDSLEEQPERQVPLELRLLDRFNSPLKRNKWESDNENLLRITYDKFPKQEHNMHYNNQLRFSAMLDKP